MLTWYLARGAGIAAFAALSVATGLGAFLSSRRPAGQLVGSRAHSSVRSRTIQRRVLLQYVHRASALTGITLLVAHIGLLLADSYAKVGWVGALVPFQSGYRPWQVSVGVVAMYLMVLVAVTGMMRSRFARSERASRLWRRIHLASYVAWAMSAWHFVVSGTDSGTWWAAAVLIGGSAIVGAGVTARLLNPSSPQLVAPARPGPERLAAPAEQRSLIGV
jgi:hypothetical protein